MDNHLIIGLGGTGGKILKAFRKRIYEEFKKDSTDKVNLSYLWVDSSAKDLNEAASWKTMGQSVHLGLSDRIQIASMSGFRFDEINRYPEIIPWIGDKTIWLDTQKKIPAYIVEGRQRKLGRLLFACNVKNFNNAVDSHVKDLCNTSNNDEITFHICCGLAGQTGSGSIIDAITQIRNKYKSDISTRYSVMLYLQIPEVIPKRDFDLGYYHANGYAALYELNALGIGAYLPHDVSGTEKDEYGWTARLLNGVIPFNSAYLFTNENEKGKIIDISEIHNAVSDFLFQKIIASKDSLGCTFRRLESLEGIDTSESIDVDGENIPLRSKRFLSFGIKRVEYPEVEIKEYVAYHFAKQALLQFKFNQWSDGIGYIEKPEEEIGIGFLTEINKPRTYEELLLADKHLMLSERIIPENAVNKDWRKIDDLWAAALPYFAQDARKIDKKEWMDELTRLCELQFNTNYRRCGVRNFYQDQQRERWYFVHHICSHIEKKMFDEWKYGKKSIIELEKYLDILIDENTKRLTSFDGRIIDINNFVEQQMLPEIRSNLNAWNNITILSDIFGKSIKIFDTQVNLYREYYTALTKEQGYRYAKDLLADVITELSKLKTTIFKFKILITSSLEEIDNSIESRCKDEDAIDSSGLMVKLYQPDDVKNITKDFICNKENQSYNAQIVRDVLTTLVGDHDEPNFTMLTSMVDSMCLIDTLEKVCIENAVSAMESLATSDPTFKTINVNVLEKIKMEYGVGERLETFVKELISSSGNFVRFDNNEMRASNPKNAMMLVLPEYADPSNFRDIFIKYFKNNVPRDIRFHIDCDVAINYKSNQLVILTCSGGFPLRYVNNIKFLRDKYMLKLTGSNADINKFYLHTEGDGSQFPNLFEKSGGIGIRRRENFSKVLLGYALGIIIEKEDIETGKKELVISKIDATGLTPISIPLGKNLNNALDTISSGSIENEYLLDKLVKDTFRDKYKHKVDQVVLKDKIVSIIRNDIFELCNKDTKNPDYVAFSEAASQFITTHLL